MIEQVVRAVAAAAGVARAGDVERAKEDLRATWSSVIGLRREDFSRLDASTARAMLGERRELARRLLEAEASLGDADAARLLEML